MTILIGTVIAYAAVVDVVSPPPEGWLPCDGRELSRATYAALFKVIGTLHGSGDGVVTFNVPDYRGRFLRGVDDGTGHDPDANAREAATLGGASGDRVGSVQRWGTAPPVGSGQGFTTSTAGVHTHDVDHRPAHRSWYEIAGEHYASWNDNPSPSSSDGLHTHAVTGGGDLETTPKSVYVHYLIACGPAAP
jgi:microcystin-dependent protein